MTSRYAPLAALAAALLLAAAPPALAQSFTAPLAGANEVPAVETDARGTAVAVIAADGVTVTVTGGFSGLESDYNTNIGSHLHRGGPDENGPVFQPLTPDLSDDLRSGTWEAEDNTYTLRPSLVDSLRAGLVYVNVHSVDNPGGEVRGQLRVAEAFEADLAGSNEVPPVETDASGSATALLNGTTVVVTGSFMGLESDYNTSIGSHLHRGGADENGPVFQPLTPVLADDLRSGTWRAEDNTYTLRQSLADSLRSGLVYVNVHSVDNPGGEVRGQLLAAAGGADGLVINEVDSDTPSTDDAEFVELYNGGGESAGLDGTVLVLFNGNDDANGSYRTIALSGAVPAGGYFVVCGTGSAVANCDLEASPATGLLQNGPDAVALYRGAAADFPNGTAPTADGLLDVVVYGTGDDDDSDLLDAFGETVQADEAAGGAGDAESIQRSPDGSDTFATAAPTPGAANVGTPTSGEAGPDASALGLRVASPLRGRATVRFETGVAGPARLEVFDLLGRRVAVLVDGPVTAEAQTATLDASRLAAGTYVLRLTGGAASVARTVTVVR